jgi:arsenate reductase
MTPPAKAPVSPAPTLAHEATFYGYDKCDTCRKAEKALRSANVAFRKIDIVAAPPDAATFRRWFARHDFPRTRWLNLSGQSYRALVADRGKAAVDALSLDQLADLFAADGKLVKRPLLVLGDHDDNGDPGETLLIGYDEAAYAALAKR